MTKTCDLKSWNYTFIFGEGKAGVSQDIVSRVVYITCSCSY